MWGGPGTAAWLHGGSHLVLREVQLSLPAWATTPGAEQDAVVGRRMEDGSPLSAPQGSARTTRVDLAATGPDGQPLVRADAHGEPHEHAPARGGAHGGHDAYDAGLVLIASTADPHGPFTPAHRTIASGDALARMSENDALQFHGQDLGHGARVWGDDVSEYEHTITVAAISVPVVVAAPGGTEGADVLDLLTQHGEEVVRTGECRGVGQLGIDPDLWSRPGNR